MSGGNVAADDLIDTQQVEPDRCTDNVHDGVDCSDFVKVDLIRTDRMNFALGNCERRE